MEKNSDTYATNKRAYIYYYSRDTYENANEECRDSHNGTLAIANNEETLKDLFDGFGKVNKRDVWFRIGLSKRNGVFKWINGSKFTENRKISDSFSSSDCFGYAINAGDTFSTARFYNVGCSNQIQYICEKRLRTKGKSIGKPRIPKTQVNVVENTPTTFRSTAAGISNTALLTGCISAAFVILALIAVAIFLIVRRKRSPDFTKKPKKKTEKDVYYSTIPLQPEVSGEKRDVSSDYATLEEERGYSTVQPDFDHLVLNSLSACPQVTSAEVEKDTAKYENVVNSNDSPNTLAEQTPNDDVKALYATVNKINNKEHKNLLKK